MIRNTILSLSTVFVLAGCATATSTERLALMDEPVDCHAAERNVELLESARPSSAEQTRSALQMLTPVGLISGAITGTLSDRAKVATGSMSDEIDEKIDAIKDACPASTSDHPDEMTDEPSEAAQTR